MSNEADDPTLPPKQGWGHEQTLPPARRRVKPSEPIEHEADAYIQDAQSSQQGPDNCRFFGGYELQQEIARGGMGVVYRARQRSLNRTVALKMVLAGELASEQDVQRFLTEAEAAANLEHPGIVPVYEVGECDGQHFFSMAFVEGQSLADRLVLGPLPPRDAAETTMKVADAIAFAHQQGVIHRDLKPANVLLDNNGEARVTDFGLAKRLDSDSNLTGTGQILGTPSFMPPEQAAGNLDQVKETADVYALGAVLYAVLTGRPPFQADNPIDTLMQVLQRECVAPRQLNPRIPRDLETICLRCLEKEPRARYPSATEMSEELGRFLRGEPIHARPISLPARCWRWCKRNPLAASMVLLLLFLAVVGPLVAWNQTRQANRLQALTDALLHQRRRGYSAEMRRIQSEFESGNVGNALQLLNLHRPQPGIHDLRQFEWYYWWRVCKARIEKEIWYEGFVTAMDVSPSGKMVAAGGFPHTVKVWDAESGQELNVTDALGASIQSLAFSPDNTLVAFARVLSQSVCLWDVKTGQHLKPIEFPGTVRAVAFSSDGRLAVLSDRSVFIWDLQGNKRAGEYQLDGNGVTVAFSPDSSTVAAGDRSGAIVAFNLDSGEKVFSAKHTAQVLRIAFSPDGNLLAAGGGDGTEVELRLWDVKTSQRYKDLLGHTQAVKGLDFSPDGSTLVSGSSDTTIRLWNVADGALVDTLSAGATEVTSVFYLPDGERIAVGGHDMTLRIWHPQTETADSLFHGHGVKSLAFSPDGRWLASGDSQGALMLWDASTGREARVLSTDGAPINRLAYSPRDSVLVVGRGDGSLTLWDATSGRQVRKLPRQETAITCLAFSADGARLAFGSSEKLSIWSMGDGHELLAIKGGPFLCAAFSPRHDWLTTGNAREDWLTIWNATTGQKITKFGRHNGPVLDVEFSPEGSILASAGDDHKVHFSHVTEMKGDPHGDVFGGPVYAVTFSPAGPTMASAGRDGIVTIWDTATGDIRTELTAHKSVIRTLAFSPEGRLLASGSDDGEIRLWRAATDAEAE